MGNKCLDNLNRCEANCCKIVAFVVPKDYDSKTIPVKTMSKDAKRYLELHNLKITKRPNIGWDITIPKTYYNKTASIYTEGKKILVVYTGCKFLTDKNLCSEYNTSKMPEICKHLGWAPILSHYLIDECAYKEKLTIGACYVLFNEEDYIEFSLDSVYNLADKIYILLGKPFNGRECKTDKTREIIYNYKDPENKIKIFEKTFPTESEHKNFLLDQCRKDKLTYCWIVDGDEIYNYKNMRMILNTINTDRGDMVRGYAREHWRSLHHSCGISSHYILFKVLDDLKIRIRCPSRDVFSYLTPKDLILFDHYGLARTPEKIREKYTITDNRIKSMVDTSSERKSIDFDLDKWMNEKFLAWEKDRNVTNLSPFKPDMWGKTHRIPLKDIPEIMKKHKWYGIDCIK